MSNDRREIELARLRNMRDLRVDPHASKSGVLHSDEIVFYAKEAQLILPFKAENLKPAGYELTIGDEAMIGGERVCLEGVDSELRIPPFEVAVVKTAETINLPRFLIARWNIRVKWAYKGLLWVGGPQVDPGYVGHLFCPIYNLSNELVKLTKGEAIALMDFVKTTEACNSESNGRATKEYERPPKRVVIEDYGVEGFRSASFSQGENIKKEISEVKGRVDLFTTFVFVILAILVTAISLPYFTNQISKVDRNVWDSLPFAFSSFAVLIALFGKSGKLSHRGVYSGGGKQQSYCMHIIIAAVISILVGAMVYLYDASNSYCVVW